MTRAHAAIHKLYNFLKFDPHAPVLRGLVDVACSDHDDDSSSSSSSSCSSSSSSESSTSSVELSAVSLAMALVERALAAIVTA